MSLPTLSEIGSFGKPHGIKGEIALSVDIDGLDIEADDFVFAKIDGLDVPFRITAVRYKGAGYLLTLKGIENELQAKLLSNQPAYMADIEFEADDEADDGDERVYLEDLIGFTLTDDGMTVGEIVDYTEPTADNPLFVVALAQGDEIFVPAADELINDIDFKSHTVDMALPQGLVDLNNN